MPSSPGFELEVLDPTEFGPVCCPEPGCLSSDLVELILPTSSDASARRFAGEAPTAQRKAETHLVHVYAKLGVKDRAAAVAVAYERGLLG